MQGEIIILKRDQQLELELKHKSQWIRDILSKIGLPVEDWSETLSMNDIRHIRAELKSLEIDIIDDTDNGIEIYYQNNLIAKWLRPRYVLRENPHERNPKDRYYLEMHINCHDVFSQNQDAQTKEE